VFNRKLFKILPLLLILVFAASTVFGATLFPDPKFTVIDGNGDPLSGGKVYFFETGTATPKTTWTDAAAGTPNANPVILDSNGQANIWIDSTSGQYRVRVDTSADVTQWGPIDNIDSLVTANVGGDAIFLIEHTAAGRHLDPDSSSYTDFATAVSTIGATETTLVVSTSEAVTGNVTVPATLGIRIIGAGELNISGGILVTFNGPFDAEMRKVFTGSGTVAFGRNVGWLIPHWWGVTGDGSTDDSTAFQAAIDAWEASTGGGMFVPAGTYLTANLNITAAANRQGFLLSGVGIESKFKAAGTNPIFNGIDMGGSNHQHLIMEKLSFDMNNKDVSAIVTTRSGQGSVYRDIFIKEDNDNVLAARSNPMMILDENDHKALLENVHIVGNTNKIGTGIQIGVAGNSGPNSIVLDKVTVVSMNIGVDVDADSISQLSVINSRLDENADVGFRNTGNSGLGLSITNTRFEENGNYGIYLEGFDNSANKIFAIQLEGNHFTDLATGIDGVFLKNVDAVEVVSNTFNGDANGRSLELSTGITDLSLAGNGLIGSMSASMDGFATYFSIDDVSQNQTTEVTGLNKFFTIADGDTTPTVAPTNSTGGGNYFVTQANTGGTAITNFTEAVTGQVITVIGGSDSNASTLASGASLKLSGAMTLGQHDSIVLFYNGTLWIEIGRTTWDGG